MKPDIATIKQLAKKVISYSIEGEEKVYRLKHTPFCVKKQYTRFFHDELESLPVVPEKIVFDNYMGKDYGCNGKYVTEALLKTGMHLDLVWTVRDAGERRGMFPKEVRLVEYGSREAMREYATAGVWAANYQMVHYLNKGLLKKPGQTYIQMWHGSFGIKKIENDCGNLTCDTNWVTLARQNSRYTDYWISNSAFETEIYRRAFWDVGEVLMYGHPRNDIFFGGGQKRARQLVERYIGKTGYRLLLYVPTFRDGRMQWEQELDFGLLKQSLEQRFGGSWLILMRLHPRMQGFGQLLPQESFCVDVTGYPDIQELLAAADAAVTDYSSAVFDFLLTGRSAFLYAPDYSDYQKLRGLYYPLEQTPFSVAPDNGSLAKNIASFDELVYKERVAEFLAEKGSVEKGTAASRVAELIVSCIKKNRKQG